MVTKSLSDISEKMRDIDFCMLSTRAERGINTRPMSNNRDVDYDGDSWFFSDLSTHKVREIEADPRVSLTFQGKQSLLGKPGIFIAVDGEAELIRDKREFEAHWNKDLEMWFEQGVDSPGLVLIKVHADTLHYWDGGEEGEVKLGAGAA